MSIQTSLVTRATIADVVAARDAALAAAQSAALLRTQALELLKEATAHAQRAHDGHSFHHVPPATTDAFQRLFARLDPAESMEAYRKQLDGRVWERLYALMGAEQFMDAKALEDWRKDLAVNTPHVTEAEAFRRLEALHKDSGLMFQRGIARVFSALDSRFKSHDAFKVGSRIIVSRVFNDWGSWEYGNQARGAVGDIERVFATLDGEAPNVGELARLVEESRQGYGPRQGVVETPYFRIRTFMNGNAHFWMLREDLVERVNLLLHSYYGEVLPDGVPKDTTEDDIRANTALSRDLAFYRSPSDVVRRLLSDVHLGAGTRVLEPSAGDGSIVRAALAKGARVDAVEVDAGRYAQLSALAQRCPGLSVQQANFLRMEPCPIYDVVLMNPPFAGTHWMAHAMHAFDFLAPGGKLVAVLPVTAEVGDSRKHRAFRAWAKKRSRTHWRGGADFTDLPAESFKASGTNINTVLLTLRKERSS